MSKRMIGTAAGLALLASFIWPAAALAAGQCFGVYPWDYRACEGAHHSFVFGTGDFLIAFLAAALSLLAANGSLAAGRIKPTAPSKPPAPAPVRNRPAAPPLPPLIDPWDGTPLIVQDGSYQGGRPGQVWYGGRWVDRAEAERLIAQDRVYVDRRDQEREAFWNESQRLSDKWLKDRTAQLEAEARAEREARIRAENAWRTYQRIRESAERHGYDDILRRADEGALKPDGSVNVDFLERLGRATRERIHRDVAAPDDELRQGWASDFIANTTHDVVHNPAIRIGMGILTHGTSEVFYQGLSAADKMREEVNRAVDQGKNYSMTDALRTGIKVVMEENLPLNTIRAMQDPNASWGQVAGSLAMDGFAGMGTLDTLRNIGGSLRAAGRGANLPSVLHHQAEPLTLLQRLTGDAESGGQPRLWKDPSDIDWQTRGPSVRHIEQPQPGGLPSHIQERINLTKNPAWRDPADGIDDLAFSQGRTAGEGRVGALQAAGRDLDAARASGNPEAIAAAEARLRDATLDVQGDKHAMHALNDLPREAGGTHPTITQFNQQMDDIYRNADHGLTRRLAGEMNVNPSDVEIVKVTNVAGEGGAAGTAAPPREHYGLARRQKGPLPEAPGGAAGAGASDGAGMAPRGDKASYDRDLTTRIRTRDGVVKDLPAEVTGRQYAESFWEASTGKPLPTKAGPDGRPVVDHEALRAHMERMDQMPTDRLHPEAYGTGQGDLDTATRDAFRARDLSDPAQVADTMRYKTDEWLNKAQRAREAGNLSEAAAHLEEGQRQLVKQFDNWGIKRTEAMVGAGNAPGARVPPSLQQEIDVLRQVGTKGLTPAQAETVLQGMGTSTRQVADALGKYQEALQVLRPAAK